MSEAAVAVIALGLLGCSADLPFLDPEQGNDSGGSGPQTTAATTVGTGPATTSGGSSGGGTGSAMDTGSMDATTGGGGSRCCDPSGKAPGCDDPDIEACVCAQDPYCCEEVWDPLCATQILMHGCGSCQLPPGSGDCCEATGEPGCMDRAVQACVCARDPFCCIVEWDDACTVGALDQCGAPCMGGNDTGDTGVLPGPCCEPSGGQGCDDPVVQDCVCLQDPFCCAGGWDAICANNVTEFGCGVCGADATTTGTTGSSTSGGGSTTGGLPAADVCCVPSAMPGCGENSAVETCVCDVDPFCCVVAWDQTCVQRVDDLGCGSC